MNMDRSHQKCPFNKNLKCQDCRLFRSELRLVGLEQTQEQVSDCVFHLIRDDLMVQHQRIHAMQAEVGETKNAAKKVTAAVRTTAEAAMWTAIAQIGDPRGVTELKKMIAAHFPKQKALTE